MFQKLDQRSQLSPTKAYISEADGVPVVNSGDPDESYMMILNGRDEKVQALLLNHEYSERGIALSNGQMADGANLPSNFDYVEHKNRPLTSNVASGSKYHQQKN